MRIFEIRYDAYGMERFAYYKSEEPHTFNNGTRFYRNYMDCKEENEKYLKSDGEDLKILQALKKHFNLPIF